MWKSRSVTPTRVPPAAGRRAEPQPATTVASTSSATALRRGVGSTVVTAAPTIHRQIRAEP